jgi:general secretion pathway protein A
MAIFNNYFGFSQNPFSITPNPAFLYLSLSHQDALGHLVYGVGQGGGFVALTGEVGTGKTTLIRSLLEQELDNIEVALCLNPQLTAPEFVANICDELNVEYNDGKSLKELIDNLNKYLLEAHAAGKRVVAIIDEAQQLSRDVLEEVRLLTNLETANEKLLRIILVGQPELQAMLARNDLRQLSQRITARSHLSPLDAKDTATYVRHRIRVAGGHPDVFSAAALKRIYRLSEGVPRLINVLCERSLMGAYSQEKRRVTVATVNRAAEESLGVSRRASWPLWLALSAGLIAASAAFGWWLAGDKPSAVESPAAVAPASVPAAAATQINAANPDYLAQQLLRQWQLDASDVTRASLCPPAKVDVACLAGEADWRMLQLIDRPALVEVVQQGRSEEVLLLSTDGEQATVLAADGAKLLPLNTLLALWNGQFTALYKNASGSLLVEPGQRSPSVTWLRRRMSMADGLPAIEGVKAEFYDTALRLRVEDFQTRYGLPADGLVGARTLALLDNLAPASGTPRLVREQR